MTEYDAMMFQQKKDVSADELRAANQFKSPHLMQGQPVVYWRRGIKGSDPYPGWAVTSNNSEGARNVAAHIVLAGGQMIRNVPHEDDPRLKWNPEQRMNGSWGFTEYDQANQKLHSTMKDLVAKAEDVATAPVAAPFTPKKLAKAEKAD